MQAIVMRCLAKTPDERYPNMAELARDVVRFAPHPGASMEIVDRIERVVRRYSDRTSPVLYPSEQLSRLTAKTRRRARWPWLVAAVLAVAGGSTLGVVVSHRGVAETAPAEAAAAPVRAVQPAPPPVVTPAPVVEPLPEPAPAKLAEDPPTAPRAPAPVAAKPHPVHHAKPPPPAPDVKKPPPPHCNPYDHMDGC